MKRFHTALALALLLPSAELAQANPGSSPLSILKGGTGAISAAAARINLGFGSTANRLYGTDGSGVSSQVTLPAAGLTLSSSALAFANDLAALEGLSSTGIARRTGTDTWSVGTAVANSELAAMAAFTFKGNNTSGSATPTDIDIAALTTKGSPAAGDYVILSDQAASGAWKKATVSSVGSAGSVSSIAGNTGAFTLGGGITNSTNQIRLANNGATLSASPGNPSGAGSASSLMMGLGSTCTITPVFSTRVRVAFTGVVFNNTNANVSTIGARYGTGTAPSNGAAATGTSMMNSYAVNHPTANVGVPFPAGGVLTGLTPATAYWIDITLAASANTSSITGVSCQAFEF